MLSTQQVLQSLIDMQANAQQALPVLPNNGNPMGANNMPAVQGTISDDLVTKAPSVQQPPSAADRYPWLRPSPSMDNVRNYLNNRRNIFQSRLPTLPTRVMEM